MPNSTTTLLNNTAVLQTLNAQLPNIVSLVLVVALGYTMANIGWKILAPQEAAEQQPVASTAPSAKQQPRQNLSNITRSYLFGKETQAVAEPRQAEAPVSRLNLTLRGVLAAEPEKFSTAIISAGKGKGGKEDIYAIGDTIQQGVVLREVHADHIIIERRGNFEKLVMPESKGAGITTSTAQISQTSTRPVTLGAIRSEIMKNPTAFGDYALPVVVKQKGKQVGYRLKPQKKGELLSQYGIKASDIITEINGVKLDNPQNGIKALRELSSAQSVNLTIKRGNAFVPLNIQLQ